MSEYQRGHVKLNEEKGDFETMKREELLKEVEERIQDNRNIRSTRRLGYTMSLECDEALRENNVLLGTIKTILKQDITAYERGCNDAWELARKMAFMTEKERDRITGWGTLGCMLDNLDYKDVHNMVEYYEEHKKLKPGDVVMYKCGDDFEKAILLYENENFYWVVKEFGGCPQQLPKDLFRLDKTYKHVNLEGLFEELKEG